MTLGEAAHGLPGHRHHRRPREPHAERSARGPARVLERGRAGVECREGGARVRQQQRSGLGQGDAARRALEQPGVQPRLKLPDLRRQRLLGERQALRRPREVQLRGDRDEGTQQASVQIDHGRRRIYSGGWSIEGRAGPL